MSYIDQLEKLFWENLSYDEFDHHEIVQLMSLEDHELEQEILSRPHVRTLLGIPLEQANVVSEIEEERFYTSSDESIPEVIRMETSANPTDKGKAKEEEEPSNGYTSKERKNEDGQPSFFSQFNQFDEIGSNHRNSTLGIQNLNIDCLSQKYIKKAIDIWAGDLGMLLKTNPRAYDLASTVLALAEHKADGTAKNLIRSVKWTDQTGADVLDSIVKALYVFFLGKDYHTNLAEEQTKDVVNAKTRLTNMMLCDIYELESFACAYNETLWKIPPKEHPTYTQIYLQKIPVVYKEALAKYEKVGDIPLKYSIAYATNLVREELAKICDLSRKQKKVKKFNKNCACDFAQSENSNLDVSPPKRVRNIKFQNATIRKKSVRNFVLKEQNENSSLGKYLPNRKTKQNTAHKAKGIADVGSVIEGHYANECPDKKCSPQNAKLLEEIRDLGYIPIEHLFEGTQNVYTLEFFECSDSSSESLSEMDIHPLLKMSLIERIQTNLNLRDIPWDLDEEEKVMNITNPNSIYIKGLLKFKNFKQFDIYCYVDTGASLCLASKNIIPEEFWENAPKTIPAKIADGKIINITKVCRNLDIQIADTVFHIPAVY